MWWKPRRIYLDYAAATPVRREALRAMSRYQARDFGNPSAIHREGGIAKQAIEAAREKLARTLRVRADEILFTSGGTESNNLALIGAIRNLLQGGVPAADIEVIATAAEHPSILRTLEALAREGVKVFYAPVAEDGRVVTAEFEKLLSSRTRLVTMALANSETGVVQDIGRIGRLIRAFGKAHEISILFHTDASQAPLWLPVALDALSVDMMTLDAGKCRGPKGIGVLVKRRPAKLQPVLVGGPQEDGLRPGTEPAALIAGGVEAIVLAQQEAPGQNLKVGKLRDRWLDELRAIPGVVVNGSLEHRLPNNVNLSLSGYDSEYAVVALDARGIAASTKSACAGSGSGRSETVWAMTHDAARAGSTIRFTLGPSTRWRELQATTRALRRHLDKMKA